MDTLNIAIQLNGAYRNDISCEFCAQRFGTMAEKNAHVLDHFEQRICQRCDQNLLRIGGKFYILHATVTCINSNSTEIKQEPETELDEPCDNGISVIQVHKIDAKQFADDFEEKQEINDDSESIEPECLDSTETFIEAPDAAIPECETNQLSDQFSQSMDADEISIESELGAEEAEEVPSSGRRKRGRPIGKKKSSKRTSFKYAEKQYNCNKCGSKNLSEAGFWRHHRNPNFKCHECGVVFCQFTSLKEHYKQHAGADPYDGIDVSSKLSIRETRARHKRHKYQCPIDGCNEMLSTLTRRYHLATKHKMAKFECDICKKKFPSLFVIRQHMNAHGASCERYKCDKCGTSNIKKSTLKRHHYKQNVVCSWCNQRFCLRKHLKQHYIKDGCGPDKSMSQTTVNRLKRMLKHFKCPVEGCDEMLSTNNRSYHMATKHTEKSAQLQCDLCKKFFATKSMIRFHILRVHVPSSKKFNCDLCGKAYLSKSILEWHHKNSHIKDRTFQCSECGKTFCQKGQLMIHLTRHTGEKPYECTFEGCSKRFRTQTGRAEHLRTHTGEKPYECPVADCDRRFAYGVDLRRHKFNAHRIYTKQFPCHICTEIFPENMLLKKHMKKHNLQV